MAQFDVYRTSDGTLVVDCQAGVLGYLGTNIVAPLLPQHEVPAPMKRLHPTIEIDGATLTLASHLLTAMPASELGKPIMSLEAERYTIIAALDLLITGI